MNSQLSLAIPGLPTNTTLYEFAQLLAWLFSDGERERAREKEGESRERESEEKKKMRERV